MRYELIASIAGVAVAFLILIGLGWWFMSQPSPSGGSSGGSGGTPSTGSGGSHSGKTQTTDMRIHNNCPYPVWVEGRGTVNGKPGAPIPPSSRGMSFKPGAGSLTVTSAIQPGDAYDFNLPEEGLPGMRVWAKYGCDASGTNCAMGDQMQYWDPTTQTSAGGCPKSGCTPPVDTLFEGTFGCRDSTGKNCVPNPSKPSTKIDGTTWFDTSQVDGYTLPYRLDFVGDTSRCDPGPTPLNPKGIDASHLDISKCPTSEDMSLGGSVPSVKLANGQVVSLKSVDLRVQSPVTGKPAGCMSPCKKWATGQPYGFNQPEQTTQVGQYMCCPTPPVSSQQCRTGPSTGGGITTTEYVKTIHRDAPDVYSFSYDDGVGLHNCPVSDVKYTMTFCP